MSHNEELAAADGRQVNVLLVHGGFADGSIWAPIIPKLQAAGLKVRAAQLPLVSTEDDVAKTREALDSLSGPTILVGHSFGGVAITNAAYGAPDAKALVYLSAFAPEQGESVATLVGMYPPAGSAAAFGYDDKGNFVVSDDDIKKYFFHDVDDTLSSLAIATAKPTSTSIYTFESGPPAWKQIPAYYAVATDDLIVNPDLEKWMAKRINAETIAIEGSGHYSFLSHADTVVDLIARAASS